MDLQILRVPENVDPRIGVQVLSEIADLLHKSKPHVALDLTRTKSFDGQGWLDSVDYWADRLKLYGGELVAFGGSPHVEHHFRLHSKTGGIRFFPDEDATAGYFAQKSNS